MKPIPEIVREFVLNTQGRMPQSDDEIDSYLDLINHAKEYKQAFELEQVMSKKTMKKFGLKTTDEIKKQRV